MILSPLKLVENDGYRPRLNPGASRVHHFSATSPKMRGPGKFGRRALFPTKNKHLLAIYSIPTRGFTAVVSVFRGTPPTKPLKCKFWVLRVGAIAELGSVLAVPRPRFLLTASKSLSFVRVTGP